MNDKSHNMIGLELGGYRIIRLLGTGGMAYVFEAESILCPEIKRALKIVRPHLASEERFVKRFLIEGALLERMNSQHIVSFHGVRREKNYLFMELELLKGDSLGDLRFEGIAHPPEIVLSWLLQAASSLNELHLQEIVHRDMKPSNLFVCEDGTLKLLDFGIAKPIDEKESHQHHHTLDGHVLGSPAFMSPEVCEGSTSTAASDIYALGLIGYQLLIGHHPLIDGMKQQNTMQVMLSHIHQDLPSLEQLDLPEGFERVLRRAASRDPRSRYQNGKEFHQALREVEQVLKYGIHPALGDFNHDATLKDQQERSPTIGPILSLVLCIISMWLIFHHQAVEVVERGTKRGFVVTDGCNDEASTEERQLGGNQQKSHPSASSLTGVDKQDASHVLEQLQFEWIAMKDKNGLSRSILKTEITTQQFQRCIDSGACSRISRAPSQAYGQCVPFTTNTSMVLNCVTYLEAQQFVGWVQGLYEEMSELQQKSTQDLIRLPSREDWVTAYSGTYPWGEDEPTCRHAIFFERAPACGAASLGPQEACSRPLGNTRSGACDLAGNLWELLDHHPSDPEHMVMTAGGGWSSASLDLQHQNFKSWPKTERSTSIGFRLVMEHDLGQ